MEWSLGSKELRKVRWSSGVPIQAAAKDLGHLWAAARPIRATTRPVRATKAAEL